MSVAVVRANGGQEVAKIGVGICGGEVDCESLSWSSSIGRDSDLSGASSGSVDDGEAEVQSSYKGPLRTIVALEDSLPMRRGISQFYGGKSKSFTSLADVSSAAKDLAKPDNPYNRKRKNLLATSMMIQGFPRRRSMGSIYKRVSNSRSSSGSITSEESPPSQLPPLHPRRKPPHSDASPPNQPSFALRILTADFHDSLR